jgi:transposase, IS6 family
VKGQERFLYRAVDSSGQTIDFLLTAKRDTAAAKRFFQRGMANPGNSIPRVINVDKNRAYPAAVDELKKEGTLRQRCKLRQCKYLNNVVEQAGPPQRKMPDLASEGLWIGADSVADLAWH